MVIRYRKAGKRDTTNLSLRIDDEDATGLKVIAAEAGLTITYVIEQYIQFLIRHKKDILNGKAVPFTLKGLGY